MLGKNRFSLSKSALIVCLITVTAFTSSGIGVYASAEDISKVKTVSSETINNSTVNNLIVDSRIKNYKDLNKAYKISGLKFKVPDYAINGFISDCGIDIVKREDNSEYLTLGFTKSDNNEFDSYDIQMSNKNLKDFLIEIHKDHEDNDISVKNNIRSSEKTIGSVKGEEIIIEASYKDKSGDGNNIVSKYFSWEDNGVYYLMNYYQHMTSPKGAYDEDITNISEEEVGKIVDSMKNIEDVKNVKYFSDESSDTYYYGVYDNEDLENAAKILEFKPKFISKINDKANISYAEVRKRDNKLTFVMEYNYDSGDKDNPYFISLDEMKDDSEYNDMRNGNLLLYKYDKECKPSKAERISINNKEVYKVKEIVPDDLLGDKPEYKYVYMWEDKGLYYKMDTILEEKEFDNELEYAIKDILNK